VDRVSGVGKDNIQVVYMHKWLAVKGGWMVFERREVRK
jgi:hypothetical protein